MCIGRPQAHIQAEAQREADRQSAQFEESLRAAEQRNADVIAAMKPKYTPPPSGTGAAMQDNQGVQRKKARKSSIVDASKGVASLRIPLNTGGTSGSGPNLG